MCAIGIGAYMFYYFYPGALSPDSLSFLTQAREGKYFDHHPPFLAILWRPIDVLFPGSAAMLFLHLFLFYGGLFLIFLSVAPQYSYLTIPSILLVGLFPPVIGIIGAIWIDITMAAFYLTAMGMLLFSQLHTSGKAKKILIAVAFAFLCVGMSFRHNGPAATISLFGFAYLIYFSKGQINFKNVAYSIFFGLIATIAIFATIKTISNLVVADKSHYWRYGAVYDIGGTSFYSKKNLYDSELFPNHNFSDIEVLYTPRAHDSLGRGEQIHPLPGQPNTKAPPFIPVWSENTNKQLMANWISAISSHPGAYLTHRYNVFKTLTSDSPWGLWVPIMDSIEENNLGIARRNPPYSALYKYILGLTKSPIFQPIYYLFISIIGLVLTLYLGLQQKNIVYMFCASLFASGLSYMTSIFFFAGSSDFRYSHWMIVCTLLGTILFAGELLASFFHKKIRP